MAGSSSDGTFGTGGGGTSICASGSGGTPGTGGATATCSRIVTTPGVLDPCGSTQSLAFSPDGTSLATASQGGYFLWRLLDGSLIGQPAQANDSNGTLSVVFSPDGKMIVTGGFAPRNGLTDPATYINTAKVWNAMTGALITLLSTHNGDAVNAATFSHDGTRLVTAGLSAGNYIDVWNVADWSETLIPVPSVYMGNLNGVNAADFSPDDQLLLTSDSGGRNRILNISDGSVAGQIDGVSPQEKKASYSPSGKLILTDGADGQLQIVDAKTLATLQVVTMSSGCYPLPVIGVTAWISDDDFLAADWSGLVTEWTASSQGTFTLKRTWTVPAQTANIAVAPDRHSFVVYGVPGVVFLAL